MFEKEEVGNMENMLQFEELESVEELSEGTFVAGVTVGVIIIGGAVYLAVAT